MFGAIPATSSWSSLKRRGPSRSASTTSSVQRSPTAASAAASGERLEGFASCAPSSTGRSYPPPIAGSLGALPAENFMLVRLLTCNLLVKLQRLTESEQHEHH